MRPAEAAPARTRAIAATNSVVTGWGAGEAASVSIVRPGDVEELRATVESASRGQTLPRGMGRSYGDAAQISGGLVIETTRLKRIEFDRGRGTVTAQAGVTIGELLREAVPADWIVPVVPGTRHVTVGGAVAGDIHGKNHGTAGTFGTHVEAISLLRADGELVELRPGTPDGHFAATVGGMGLTGIVVDARIKLSSVRGAMLSVDTGRVSSLDDALAALVAPGGPHRVAWLDLLCAHPGRGIVTRAQHVDTPGEGKAVIHSRGTVPRAWPGGALRPGVVRSFNALKFASARRGSLSPGGAGVSDALLVGERRRSDSRSCGSWLPSACGHSAATPAGSRTRRAGFTLPQSRSVCSTPTTSLRIGTRSSGRSPKPTASTWS